MSKFLTAVGLSMVLLFGGAASCDGGQPTDFNEIEFPDCDADDRTGKWDTADCGPSPRPRESARPMKTAYQPKPR